MILTCVQFWFWICMIHKEYIYIYLHILSLYIYNMSYTYCFTVLLLQAMTPSPDLNIEKSWSNKLGDATWRHRLNSGLMKNYTYLRVRSPRCWLKWCTSMPFYSVYTCTLYYMLNEFLPILYIYISIYWLISPSHCDSGKWQLIGILYKEILDHSGSHCWRGTSTSKNISGGLV